MNKARPLAELSALPIMSVERMTIAQYKRLTSKKRVSQPKRGEMNATELAYAHLLDDERRAGLIINYHYERLKLLLAPKTTYTPDFLVIRPNGRCEIHEVKGEFIREDALVKFKFAADMFKHCFDFYLCVKRSKANGGGWQITKY